MNVFMSEQAVQQALCNIHNPEQTSESDCEADETVASMGPSVAANEEDTCEEATPLRRASSSTSECTTSKHFQVQDASANTKLQFEILNCITYLHNQNIVHCDLVPTKDTFCLREFRWKLPYTCTSMKNRRSSGFSTQQYAAPEIVKAEEKVQTSITPAKSLEMYSFGVLDSAVLTGNRFNGPTANSEFVKDRAFGRQDPLSLEPLETAAQTWLRDLLCQNLTTSWSAQIALKRHLFQTAEYSTQRRAIIVKPAICKNKEANYKINRQIREQNTTEIQKTKANDHLIQHNQILLRESRTQEVPTESFQRSVDEIDIEALSEETRKDSNESSTKKIRKTGVFKKLLRDLQETLPRETGKEVKKVMKEFKETLLVDIRREVKEPMIEEIKEVGSVVSNVLGSVVATYQEISRANLMVKIDLERVGSSKGIVDLTDRDGRRVVTLSDDFLPDEPVFLLRYDKLHRMRISLTHIHQSEAAKFRIHSVSVQPSDDVELSLECTETKPTSEGNEVAAWFHSDMFPHSRLNRRCQQFGSVDQKYVQVSMKIVVEMASNDSSATKENFITINGRIWCMSVSKFSFNLTTRKFARFASEKWKRAPQWMRDAGRGAVILMDIGSNVV